MGSQKNLTKNYGREEKGRRPMTTDDVLNMVRVGGERKEEKKENKEKEKEERKFPIEGRYN